MPEQKLNNGYCFVVHYQRGDLRTFGPYRTTNEAMKAFQSWSKLISPQYRQETKLKIENGQPERPVIGRKYKLNPNEHTITAVEISVLEFDMFAKWSN